MKDKTEPSIYEIRIKESLNDSFQAWFEGMQMSIQPDGSTLLTGVVVDQSALSGLLNKVSLLGLTLISVNITA